MQVRDLSAGTPVATPPATVPPAQLGGAMASLMTAPLAIPSLDNLPSSGVTYIGFASTRSPKWGQMQSLGMKEGDFFVAQGEQILPVKEPKIWLLSAHEFRTKIDDTYRLLAASKNMADRSLEEHYICAILVKVNDELVPAKADFRTTKANIGTSAIRAIHQATSPTFAQLSEAHKVAAACPMPFARMGVKVSVRFEVSKSSGRNNAIGYGTPVPSTVDEITLIAKSCQDKAFIGKCNSVLADVERSRLACEALCK